MSQAAVREAQAWYWQRISAMVLALCVVLHIAIMIYAVRGGLSGSEILARTRGSVAFAAFYSVFVLACAVHVPLGMARIAEEWAGFSAVAARWIARGFAVLLFVLGLRAVFAVFQA
jgi:fumarate reductase subunit C